MRSDPFNSTIYSQCDQYQEQSFLLDPWLDKIVVPPVEAFRQYIAKVVSEDREELISERFFRLARIIYQIVKTRGYKTIGNDASCPLEYLLTVSQYRSSHTRYPTLKLLSSSWNDTGSTATTWVVTG
jgi:hypothetical protein